MKKPGIINMHRSALPAVKLAIAECMAHYGLERQSPYEDIHLSCGAVTIKTYVCIGVYVDTKKLGLNLPGASHALRNARKRYCMLLVYATRAGFRVQCFHQMLDPWKETLIFEHEYVWQ